MRYPSIKSLPLLPYGGDRKPGEPTPEEIAERARELGLHREPESIRKRASELEDMRMIQVVEVRRCSITNKVAESFRLVD